VRSLGLRPARGESAPDGGAALAGQAAGAQTVELDAVVRDPEARSRGHARLEPRVDRLGQIEDPPAGRTREVMVTVHAGVEADARALMDLGQEPLLGEEPQVPVDGAEAHPGQMAPHGRVHPLGRGMALRLPHDGKDQAARRRQAHPAPGEVRPERRVPQPAPGVTGRPPGDTGSPGRPALAVLPEQASVSPQLAHTIMRIVLNSIAGALACQEAARYKRYNG
jgi:hypothetical protein